MQLLYRINQTGTTVLVATHDVAMVDKMRRRVIELADGKIVRDEQAGAYAARESTREFAVRMRGAQRLRPIFFLREAIRALKRNAIPSFAAMATVLVTVLVLGVFIPVVQATTGAANEVRNKVIADVYLKTDVKKARHRPRRAPAEGRAAGRQGRVHLQGAGVQDRERKRNPKAYELLGSNPLPDTFRVTPRNPDDIGKLKDALAPQAPGGGTTVVDPAIDEVKQPRGGHEQDPLGHPRREDHDGAAARACSASRRCC